MPQKYGIRFIVLSDIKQDRSGAQHLKDSTFPFFPGYFRSISALFPELEQYVFGEDSQLFFNRRKYFEKSEGKDQFCL